MREAAMELLAPAGGEEQLDYAIRFGADAVYLGCERFGMRARAHNFALADLPRVVGKAHRAGAKVHLACNVMMHQEDIAALPSFLEQAEAAGVDALIVGDLGVVPLACRYAPGADIHVSTQASVCNAEAAKVWHSLGATRVVAAREMSLTELADMKHHMPDGMELEAFAHGAMCMAYSGRCLISDFMNRGRSGIRGNCSQSCRWQYALVERLQPGKYYPVEEDARGSYLLNAEDLCMLEHVDEMAEVGIDSIKIEGRNKKAYYVACVVNAYRQVLDGADPGQFIRELDCVSHRPYSTGFYFGQAHQTPEDLVYIRKTSWAAQVITSEQTDSETYRIELKCRSRFSLLDSLEVLSPHKPIRSLRLDELWYIPNSRLEVLSFTPSADWEHQHLQPQSVTQAGHPGERYYATTTTPVKTGDIIRVLR